MKLRLHLLHLEKEVPESILTVAERYYEEGRVSRLRQVDTGLWQAGVLIEQAYEPEILLRGNRVHGWSCDCTPGRKKNLCAHVVATLLLLRSFLEQQRARLAGVRGQHLRLEAKDLLPLIPADALKAFLLAELRLSPELTLALRARFYHLLQPAQSGEYRELLLAPYVDEHGALLTDDATLAAPLRLIFRQLLLQSERLYGEGDTQAAMDNLHYLLARLARSPATRLREQLLRRLTDWVVDGKKEPTEGANDGRFRFLLALLPPLHSLPQSDTMERVLVEVQGYAGFEEARRETLPVVRELLQRTPPQSSMLLPLLLVYFQNLSDRERQEDWLMALRLPRLSPPVYEQLGQALGDAGDYEDAILLLNQGVEQYPAHIPLQRQRRKLLWELHDFDELERQSLALVSATCEVSDLQAAIQWLPAERLQRVLHSLGSTLAALPPSFKRFTLACALARYRQDWPLLGDELLQSGSRKLLIQHVPALHEADPSLATRVMVDFVQDYLEKHIGPPSYDTVQSIADLCREQGMKSVSAALRAMLKKHFPERGHLHTYF